LYTMSLWP